MKVLFITSSPIEVNNSAMISNIALMKGFVDLGHDVSVVSFKPYSKLNNEQNKHLKGINAIRLEPNRIYSTLVNNNKSNGISNTVKKLILNFARKIYHNFGLFDNYKKAIDDIEMVNLEEYYDIVISCSDPKSSHLLAEKIIKNNKNSIGSWIQYWGDPMTIDISRKSKLPNYFVKKIERQLLKKANKVVYVSPFTLQSQKNLFPELEKKLYFIPLPYQEEKIYNSDSLKEKRNIMLGYFGSYNTRIRNIFPLYQVMEELPNYKLKIVGDSNTQLIGTKNVIVEDRQSYDVIEKYEEESDILIVICNNSGTQIPGKLFYYAATNKPILVVLDGETERLQKFLSRYKRFVFCNNTESDIKNAIIDIVENKVEISNNPVKNFNPQNVATQFINTLKY